MNARLTWSALLIAGGLAIAIQAVAAGEPVRDDGVGEASRPQSLPGRVTLGVERLRLPRDEAVGLLGVSYIAELSPGWWLGPALYGAAAGRRGGLFTWGVEAQRLWRLDARWQLGAGLFVGGGGGAGAEVGGGLMLRPHADLMLDFGAWATGISASQVRFPSGSIRSTQLGLLVAVPDAFTFVAPGHAGERVAFAGSGGLGADRVSVVAGRYGAGLGNERPLTYVGMRLQRQLSAALAATMQGAGAATGGADGYAEFLLGALALWPVDDSALRFGAHASVGLGGGGSVATGGGPIAKAAWSGSLRWSPQLSLALEAGRVRAFSGTFSAHFVQLSLGMTLGDGPFGSTAASSPTTVRDMQWALSAQNYLRARRKDGSVRSLSSLGLTFQRSVSEQIYLTGQAHSAIGGGAGAFSLGLLGLGVTQRLPSSEPWSLGAEASVGAGGGGGVASGGGAIVQPMVWLGRDLGGYSRIKLGVGYVKSLRGELSSAVVALSWAVAFGVP
jgi:hypothetical protein